ncbi:MAG: hypothetical protein KIS81_12315, partial [Maricaulaceae bacterium]|nr:hypothetical protein [Maricaulaceae bacterium]
AEGDGFVLTPEGQAALKRAAAAGPDRFAAQHRDMAPKQVMAEDGRLLTLMANRAASPLAPWTRPGRRGGPPLLTAAEYAAGERLRADWFRSTLFRRVTADFTAPPQGAAPRSPKGAEDAPLSAIAAKDRVMAALAAAGPAGGRLLNALLFRETTMTAAETEAGLRRRGGRAALKQALARVAAYYGTK